MMQQIIDALDDILSNVQQLHSISTKKKINKKKLLNDNFIRLYLMHLHLQSYFPRLKTIICSNSLLAFDFMKQAQLQLSKIQNFIQSLNFTKLLSLLNNINILFIINIPLLGCLEYHIESILALTVLQVQQIVEYLCCLIQIKYYQYHH